MLRSLCQEEGRLGTGCAGKAPGVSREGTAASWTKALQVAFEVVALLFVRT